MRVKRVDKFKRNRYRKSRKLIFFAVVIPCLSIFIGYLVTSLVILPVMAK